MRKLTKVAITVEDKESRFDALQRRATVLNNGQPVDQVAIMKWLLSLGEKDMSSEELSGSASRTGK